MSDIIDTKKNKSADDKNQELFECQKEWARCLYNRLKEEYYANEEEVRLSCAFSFGVSANYMKSTKKIMIVGQEANGHTFEYEKWNLESWQKWAVAYLNYQVYNEKSKDYSFSYNGSPFWQFFRKLKENGYGVCWNNLDKVRRYVKVDGKEWKERKLPYGKNNDNSEREILNRKIFDADSKSLLQKEIEIVDPDIVVFVIGPSNPYYHTLYFALLEGDNDYDTILNKLKCPYPTAKKECVNIQECSNIKDILSLKMPLFYTYHPNYLRQTGKGKLENVIEQITGKN